MAQSPKDAHDEKPQDPFDSKFYSLTGPNLEFFKEAAGIDDETQLRDHIIKVSKKAFSARYFL